MVLSWDITEIVKKKNFISSKDKKDWTVFTKQMGNISAKESDILKKNIETNKVLKKFIIESFNQNYKKLLIVTGKGSRSKSYDNPYLSEKLSVLKYAVPEYINNDENLINKIRKISKASLKDGGEGAIYIFLKNSEKFKE